MIKLKELISEEDNKNRMYESLNTPYKYRNTFRTEMIDYDDEETGGTYKKEVLYSVQIVKFKTNSGIPYLWYAKQNRHDDTLWEIAFGVEKSVDDKEKYTLDIEKTGTGDAFRIFATVIDIINSFVEFSEDYDSEVIRLMFTAKGNNRIKLYINRIVPRIDNFKIEDIRNDYGETVIFLVRTN